MRSFASQRLVEALLGAGIEPLATLYHWDLPQTLQDRWSGWQSAETAKAVADYAGYVAEQLGDRVRHYFTINEFASFVEQGYQGADVQVGGGKTLHIGTAPGLRLSDAELKQVRHHAVLGHGLAVQAIRARGPAGTKVGFAENIRVAVPVIDTPEHVQAAEAATCTLNAGYTTVMLEGRYLEDYLAEAGGQTPRFTDDEVGLACLRPRGDVLGAAPDAVDLGRRVHHHRERLRGRGCGRRGRPSLRQRPGHVPAGLPGPLQRATAEGVPVDGYFHWSAQDNLEWVAGFGDRFGLVYVDFDTLERKPKLSAEWFREAAPRNAVV